MFKHHAAAAAAAELGLSHVHFVSVFFLMQPVAFSLLRVVVLVLNLLVYNSKLEGFCGDLVVMHTVSSKGGLGY